MSKRIVFQVKIDEKKIDLYFSLPTHEEVLAIDMEYRKIYSMAVREGIITQAEALKKYKEQGAWTKEDDDDLNDFMVQIALLEIVIKDETKEEKERADAALKTTKLRSDLLQKMNVKTGLFDSTAEQMADEQKTYKYILLCCRQEEDDEKFFESRQQQQDFANNYRDQMSFIYRRAYFFSYNLPEDITSEWAEVQFLKNIAEKEAKKLNEKQPKKKRAKKLEVK